MTIFVPDASLYSVEVALYYLFMYGDPAQLDTIMGEIPDSLDSEDMNIQSDTDRSGDSAEESYGDITEEESEIIETREEGDTGARDTDMDRLWERAANDIYYSEYSDDSGGLEWEHNGVDVDETVDVDNREYYGGLTPGRPGFATSTEVKRNPIRPASFVLTNSRGTEDMRARRQHGDTHWYPYLTGDKSHGDIDVMKEEDDTEKSLAWEDNGVMVDENESYLEFRDGSILTSTGVKKNPIIRPASFSPSSSPSSLGSSFTSSPLTEARWMRRVIGENQVRESSFDMYLWQRSLYWHFATSL